MSTTAHRSSTLAVRSNVPLPDPRARHQHRAPDKERHRHARDGPPPVFDARHLILSSQRSSDVQQPRVEAELEQ